MRNCRALSACVVSPVRHWISKVPPSSKITCCRDPLRSRVSARSGEMYKRNIPLGGEPSASAIGPKVAANVLP